MAPLFKRLLVAAIQTMLWLVFSPGQVLAQNLVPPQELVVTSLNACSALAPKLIGRGSGGQWLVGDGIALTGRPNAFTPLTVLNKTMTKVTCYNHAFVAGHEKVFVKADNGSVCGWVDRSSLLPVNRLGRTALDNRPSQTICETPRAISFKVYCERFEKIGQSFQDEEECKGIPPQLRTKGVLIGSTVESTNRPRYHLLSAPVNGKILGTKSFFSVLEIHDVHKGARGEAMLLVGDGSGELFGWIDRRALRLWPTRLALYYDENGKGGMFLRESSMKENFRKGIPRPELSFNGTSEDLATFLHGRLPLVAYPIIRTVDPTRDPLQPPGQPAWHEVIFIGKTGEGKASKLIDQAVLSNKIQQLRRVNVIFVVDTTESMTEYLPSLRQGIAEFIRSYNSNAIDASKRLPEMRLSVVAYSDFLDKEHKKLGDKVKAEVLMPPTTIGPDYDVDDALHRIVAHQGLADDVGEFDEAGLEAVVQTLRNFDEPRSWFPDGPRIIVHIGDHGSRESLRVNEVARELARYKAYYIPIAVVTDDKGDTDRRDSRARFTSQGLRLLAPLIESDGKTRAEPADVRHIEMTDRRNAAAKAVAEALDLVVIKVTAAINRQRRRFGLGSGTGSTGSAITASTEALDRAASRIRLDEALERQYGLNKATLRAMAQADKAFAPLRLRRDGLEQPIDWSYFVAFEPEQVGFLQPVLENLCALSGRADQRARFRALIVRMAEIFSGDRITRNEEMTAILSDLATLPGVKGSFLSIPGTQLLQRIDSDDPAVQEQLRRDVCWISYHLNNVVAGSYARPEELAWNPQTFRYQLAPGRTARARNYRYVPLVGAETVYLPTWMFVVPSQVDEIRSNKRGCTGWTCN